MKINYYWLLLAVALVGCHTHKEDKHSADEKHGVHSDEIIFTPEQAKSAGLRTEIATVAPFQSVLKASGRIQSSVGDECTLVATSSGVVTYCNASIAEGVAVKKGVPLLSISAKDMLEGEPTEKARVDFETTRAEYERSKVLAADKIISLKELEQARSRYEQASIAYKATAKNYSKAGVHVASTMNGYIKSLWVRQGEYVSAGQTVAVVSQSRRLQLCVDVPPSYYSQLSTLGSANFRTATSGEIYRLEDLNGRLLSYGRALEKGSAYIPVTFELDNRGNLIPGQFVEVFLLSKQLSHVVSVPVSALTEEQGSYYVYVQIDEEGYLKKEVKLGQTNGERVSILQGIKPNDKVVISAAYQVKQAASSGAIPDGHNH
ncbi:MAG: efflux RND transporter periplasmic adaptor subunit [Bacteroidaceae bacterium]